MHILLGTKEPQAPDGCRGRTSEIPPCQQNNHTLPIGLIYVLQTTGGRGAKLLQAVKLLSPRLTNITIAGTGVPVEVLAILDPLSKTAQRVAPVLDFLQKTLGIPLKVSLC